MGLEQIITYAVFVFALGFGIWLIRRDISGVNGEIKAFRDSQHACQIANAKEFVTKRDLHKVEEKVCSDLKELEERQDKTSEDVAVLKALNGKQ